MPATGPRPPADLGAAGKKMWREIVADHPDHTLDAIQKVQLTEACRMKDRLDKLDAVLRGDAETWMRLTVDVNSHGSIYELRITNALGKANETANAMKQLIAAMRLPDVEGKRPQRRGPRGAQNPTVAGGAAATPGKVSSMDRARERAARKASPAGA